MTESTTVSTGTETTDTTSGGETGVSSTDTTAGSGSCGWVDTEMLYGCGGEGEDPSEIFAIDCVEEPVQGGACDVENGPITAFGCCTPGGASAVCSGGTIQIVRC